MAEARGRFEWNQTSQVLAMIHNRSGFGTTDPLDPSEFNPYESDTPGDAAFQVDKCVQYSAWVPELTNEQKQELLKHA